VRNAQPVSVVIVSYNTCDLLRRCLQSLSEADEIIVVDNASADGSAEMVLAEFPETRLIRNKRNIGFGAANNLGIGTAQHELVLLLNSDARATSGAVAALASVFEDPGVVAAGGKLTHPDGKLQESAANELTLWAVFCEQFYLEKLFPTSKWLSPYWVSRRLLKRSDQPHPVAQVMGACLMMRKGADRFDERFFLYCEDTELCRRLQKHGRILYAPRSQFEHELGASSSGTRWQSVALYNRGKELYFEIHRGKVAASLCWGLNRAGSLLRFVVWGIAALVTLGTVGRFRRHAGLFFRTLFAPMDMYAWIRSQQK
jgi:N-acetylglucosaminyl-diphospho-decaprenol L-rhamnosyltransferase